MTRLSNTLLAVFALIVLGVGLFDAVASSEWDLAASFAIGAVLVAFLVVRQAGPRVPVTLRADLARRLDTRASTSDEPIDDIVDRSVAWYLDGFARDD